MDSDSETEFEYPDIQPANVIQPFMFEPPAPEGAVAADGPNSSSEEEDDDINVERIGNTDWYETILRTIVSSYAYSTNSIAEASSRTLFLHFSRCTCGHCVSMTKGRESVCCQETATIRERAGHLNCITLHEGFVAVCLNRYVIETVVYQYIDEEEGGYIDDRPTFE